MLEVVLDGLDRVLLTNEIRRLLADHHLRGVRVAGHRSRDNGRVGHTQAFDTTNAETFSAATSSSRRTTNWDPSRLLLWAFLYSFKIVNC